MFIHLIMWVIDTMFSLIKKHGDHHFKWKSFYYFKWDPYICTNKNVSIIHLGWTKLYSSNWLPITLSIMLITPIFIYIFSLTLGIWDPHMLGGAYATPCEIIYTHVYINICVNSIFHPINQLLLFWVRLLKIYLSVRMKNDSPVAEATSRGKRQLDRYSLLQLHIMA